MMSTSESPLYRPGVGVMLLNPARQVFVAQRIDTPGAAWQMPQGGIDGGEEPEAAAFRELREEIGTDHAELLAASADWYDYDLPESLRHTLWGGRYRGQRQRWFVMRFLGEDAEINLATRHPEFSSWRWASPSELPGLIVPFKRVLYERLLEDFRVYLTG